MRTMRRRIWLAAIAAAGLAGCGGSLADTRRAGRRQGRLRAPRRGLVGNRRRRAARRPRHEPLPGQARGAGRRSGVPVPAIPDAAACTGIGIRVHVMIDGTEVPRLPDDGWTFIDATETSIELHGTACERASQSPTGVTIYFTFYLP